MRPGYCRTSRPPLPAAHGLTRQNVQSLERRSARVPSPCFAEPVALILLPAPTHSRRAVDSASLYSTMLSSMRMLHAGPTSLPSGLHPPLCEASCTCGNYWVRGCRRHPWLETSLTFGDSCAWFRGVAAVRGHPTIYYWHGRGEKIRPHQLGSGQTATGHVVYIWSCIQSETIGRPVSCRARR